MTKNMYGTIKVIQKSLIVLALTGVVVVVNGFCIVPETSSSRLVSSTSLDGLSRRELLDGGVSAASLAALLIATPLNQNQMAWAAAAAADDESPPKTILMTGSNSGIGFYAAKKLADAGHTLILPCRTMDKSVATVNTLTGGSGSNSNIIPAECDLADLKSIEKFGKELPSLLGTGVSLDVACWNAGLARNTGATDVARTKDGFELTVGTNHLGHFYLNSLVLPTLQSQGRIVITASSVHDPDSPGGAQGQTATLGDLTGLERDGANFEMVDGNPFNADKAYKDSKLCNVFFMRELQRRLEASPTTKGICVNAFTPGLIVGTGLFRDQPKLFTKIFDFAATDLLKVGETPEWGGSALTYMTGMTTRGEYYFSSPGSSKYGDAAFGNQFGPATPSVEAQDDAKGKRLWELSAKLVGIQA